MPGHLQPEQPVKIAGIRIPMGLQVRSCPARIPPLDKCPQPVHGARVLACVFLALLASFSDGIDAESHLRSEHFRCLPGGVYVQSRRVSDLRPTPPSLEAVTVMPGLATGALPAKEQPDHVRITNLNRLLETLSAPDQKGIHSSHE